MPLWRCPHCGTPQAETARCWVCRRSSTSCRTCRNFRTSVANGLGYCGLDRLRQPLTGTEMRACWEADPPGSQEIEPTFAQLGEGLGLGGGDSLGGRVGLGGGLVGLDVGLGLGLGDGLGLGLGDGLGEGDGSGPLETV